MARYEHDDTHKLGSLNGPRLMTCAIIIGFLVILFAGYALAKDRGQYTDADTKAWFERLMQPDNPAISCCGEADAYWADSFDIEGQQYVAIVTDARVIVGRPSIPVGTRIVVPAGKLKWDAGNPTGHGIIFLLAGSLHVWCYLPPGGV